MKFATKALHAGIEPDPVTGAIMTPIYQTSTYVQDAPGKHKGYAYARGANPTRDVLQTNLAALENGKHALCFSSGMGATDSVIKLLNPGDEVLCTHDLYGGTYRLFSKVFERFGISFKYIPMTDAGEVEQYVTPKTRMMWIETPTNPLMTILDIKALAQLGKNNRMIVVVDNTFASPYLQNPLDLGADIVLHSATKYIGGHSDVVMGALVMNNDKFYDDLKFIQNSTGATPGPQDCFLALRGVKTLHLRMERHCKNAMDVAKFLKKNTHVERVYYPGLAEHPNHDVARSQMKDFGGMISFTLKGDNMQQAVNLMTATRIFSLAESLGGVESLIGHPATMTHAAIPREQRIANGLSDTLIRLSVGVEDIEDLIADLDQAINSAMGSKAHRVVTV